MNALSRSLLRTFRSIRTRITLSAVAALVVGIAATSFVQLRQAERDTLAMQRERELHEAARSADILSRGAVDLQRALVSTAAIVTPAELADPAKLTHFVETKPVLRGLFSGVFFADRNGRMLLLADADGVRYPEANVADRGYFKQAASELRPIVSEALISKLTAQPIITFVAPIVHRGEFAGVIGASLRLSNRDLLADVVQQSEARTDSLQIVTDSHGRILGHPDRSRIMQPLSTEPRMAQGYQRWLDAGAPAEPLGVLIEQPGEVLAVAGAPGANWLLWRALPESELLAPLHAARRQALLWARVVVAAAALIVFGLIGWLLRPLLLLKRRALHLFDSGQDIGAGWPNAGGEIGALERVLRQVGTERAQLEHMNADVLARLGSVMAAAPVGILFTRAGRFELVSAECCRILGRPESSLLGNDLATLFVEPADPARLDAAVGAAFRTRTHYSGEWKLHKAGAAEFWGRLRAQAVDHDRPEAGTIWTLVDVSEQRAAREELEWSAAHDPLTGLANRKLFEHRATAAWKGRPDSVPCALIMIDLDRFKPINDTAGHAAGDAMLQAVAQAITTNIRASDLAARVGGDEFALLLEGCPAEAAERIAHDVRRAVADIALPWQDRWLGVGASLGLASLTHDTPSVAAWMQAADAACYEAKAAGRNTVRVVETPAPADSDRAAAPVDTAATSALAYSI